MKLESNGESEKDINWFNSTFTGVECYFVSWLNIDSTQNYLLFLSKTRSIIRIFKSFNIYFLSFNISLISFLALVFMSLIIDDSSSFRAPPPEPLLHPSIKA